MAVVSRPIKPDRSGRAERLGRLRTTPLLMVLSYGLALLAALVLLQSVVVWGQRSMDSLRYGFPRRVVVAGFVGHGEDQGEPTRIITLNINGQVSMLELPGGDSRQLKVYEGPYLVGRDSMYVVPLPQLRDMNGDGHVDLLITVRDETLVYLNRDGAFHALTPEERAELVGVAGGTAR